MVDVIVICVTATSECKCLFSPVVRFYSQQRLSLFDYFLYYNYKFISVELPHQHAASYIIYHIPYIIYHTSYTVHISYIIYHTSYIIHHISYITYHTSYIKHRRSYIIYHIPYITYQTSYIIYNRS